MIDMKKVFIFIIIMFIAMVSEAKRPRVALVLGGGGAKGAAEVGALKVIERAGIPIDMVVGTSIGSIVGGLYSCGYTSAQLDTIFRTQEWLSLLTDRNQQFANQPYVVHNGVTYVFGFPVLDKNSSSFGMMRGEKIEHLLDSMSGYRKKMSFDSLPIPFRCVAVDIKTTTEHVLGKGKLSKAMRASMAIPGIFKPVAVGDLSLVDGGMLNNLPTDVARRMGADIIIAIDLQQEKQKTKDFSLKEQLGIGGILDWFVSRPDVKKYHENVRLADIYINPPLPDYDASSFGNKKCMRMMQIGEEAALKQWEKLMKLKLKILSGL
jgi:NTE family protein